MKSKTISKDVEIIHNSKLGWKAFRHCLWISAYCSLAAWTESVKFLIISWVASGFVPTEDKFWSSTSELGDAANAWSNNWAPAKWLCWVGGPSSSDPSESELPISLPPEVAHPLKQSISTLSKGSTKQLEQQTKTIFHS
jgi:hypothetical protein